MQTFLRFPNFKSKAVTLSYDDAVFQDERLISIMKKYGLKGTFNVNGGIFKINDKYRFRMNEEQALKVYEDSGMEVAMHGKEHIYLKGANETDMFVEFYEDKLILEKVFGEFMRGGAYAYGDSPDKAVSVLDSLGVKYFRTTKSSLKFDIPTDWLRLQPTCHHKNEKLFELVDSFINVDPDSGYRNEPKLFYLWGHSYEFDLDNNWDLIEKFAEKISFKDDTWYATNIEIYDYVKAYESLEFSVDGKKILNNSSTDVYLFYDRKQVLAKAGKITVVE